MIHLQNNLQNVSFFAKEITQKTPTKTITIHEFLDMVRTGKYASQINALRQEIGEEVQKELKKKLSYITTSGTFSYASDDKIIAHSGLIQVDIDHLPLDQKETLKGLLSLDEYFMAVFDSPTNTGLKGIVKIPANTATHLQSFQSLEAYVLQSYGVQIDKSCKNVSRAMFVSYDKDLHTNLDSKIFENLPTEQGTDYEALHKIYTQDFANTKPTTGKKYEDVFELCVDWVQRKHTFSEKQKSIFRYCLACLLCEFGVSETKALAYITQNYGSASGEAKDKADVKSAYQKATADKRAFAPYSEWKAQKEKEREEKTTQKEAKNAYNEEKIYTIKEGEIVINNLKLVEKLQKMGFRRYDLEVKDKPMFIHIENNIVRETSITQIEDYFFQWLEKNHIDEYSASLNDLKNKLYKGVNSYFSERMLYRLGTEPNLKIIKDTKDKSFFYFQNGIVEVTENELKLVPYSQMKGNIWKNQILNREFQVLPEVEAEKGYFAQFCNLIAKQDHLNFECLKSIIGYLLHDFKENKRKAVNFTDSSLERGNNGRTGKTLLAKALGLLRVYGEINGKNFEPANKHKYQDLKLDTQFINLNDVNKKFKLEWIYNDITEGLMVEKKNQTPFRIKPNIVICSNLPLELEGGSDKDRVVEFEFSNIFSIHYSPKDHFKHWFFGDWDNQEWNKFDNFMLYCVKFYLRAGEMIQPENTNLATRKLMEFTSPEFVEFIEAQELKAGIEYEKKVLLNDFIGIYTDFDSLKMKTFTKWLRIYAESKPTIFLWEGQNGNKQSVFKFQQMSVPVANS